MRGLRDGTRLSRLCPIREQDQIESVMRPAERISQRNSITNHLAGCKFDVIVHQIEVALRADENIGRDVKSQAGAEVPHKMRAGRVVGTAYEIASIEIVVKAHALRPDACLKFAFHSIIQLGHPHPVEVPENWTVRLIARIQSLARLPRYLSTNSELIFRE